MANKTAQHILPTATNLLGFCLIILTSLHITDVAENNFVDELTLIVVLLLTICSGLSFVSIKTENDLLSHRLERIADVIFFISLLGIFAIAMFLTVIYWHK